MYKAIRFIKRNAVLCIAIMAALITSYFVRPDKEYISYFDFKTLTCLFCVLAVVCALKNINFFYMIAQNIVVYFKNARVKVEVGLCKGKKNYDKRDATAQRDAKREIDRTMKERNR